MSTLITVLHVIVCLFLMLTVLLQSGKGGGMGGAFGGSNAGTVFGGSGASTFLRKLTAGAATIFMLTSMTLAFIASHNAADSLEKFSETEQKKMAEKQTAKDQALKAGSGSAGSAAPSIMLPPGMGSADGADEVPLPAPSMGSAATDPAQPSMTNPAEKPAPLGTAPVGAPTEKLTPAEQKLVPAQTPNEKAAAKANLKEPLTGTAAPTNPQPMTEPLAPGPAPAPTPSTP